MANGLQLGSLADRLAERISVLNPARLQRMVVLEELNAEETLAQRMQRLKTLWASYDPPSAAQYDVENLEFDPIKINQEACTYFELLLRDRVNQAARAVTLAFAIGTDLEAIASRYPGGVPRLEGESDERYRRRIWLSPNTLSPHGTAEAYEYWALTALPLLRDVTAIKAVAHDYYPTIVISCLMGLEYDDPRPTQQQLVLVRSYIQDLSRMGLTDVISVSGPKVKETAYNINVYLYHGTIPDQAIAQITSNLQQLIVNQYWLGHDHTHTAIHAVCALPGVHHIEILEPATDIYIPSDWVVKVTAITLTIAGRMV
jgi:phage-related baseplate assembly protein